jgi:CheY-like chemotaxis protein
MTPHTLHKPSSGHPLLCELKVLLVDDDPFQLEVISEVLRGLDVMLVSGVESSEAALKLLTSAGHGYNLVLLDLHMPGMDGFEFMEALAKADYSGALIIVSGQSGDVMHAAELVAKLRRFALLGAVSKPVGRVEMASLLRSYCRPA